MKILKYVKRIDTIFEGIIYKDDNGKEYITNGVYKWEVTEEKLKVLKKVSVNEIDIIRLYGRMLERFYYCNDLLKELKEEAKIQSLIKIDMATNILDIKLTKFFNNYNAVSIIYEYDTNIYDSLYYKQRIRDIVLYPELAKEQGYEGLPEIDHAYVK